MLAGPAPPPRPPHRGPRGRDVHPRPRRPRLTLLTADDDPRWQPQAEAVRRAGIPLALRSVRTAARRETVPGQWARLLGADRADTALLVRPDGHIAWRGTCPADPRTLPALVRRVLAAP
ncbi:hypothetical protein [Streptomyces sp. NPDC094462]|uniref:aromatic-ring hydroxylase C-terminal domain-containing protein n=1 Tax=Streptomyces sp. NPDC094462 TaxID=3155311 RepID=UPI00332BD762